MACAGVVTVTGGGDSSALRERLDGLAASRSFRAVVSVGLGGALSPALNVGDWVVGERIVGAGQAWGSDPGLVGQLHASLAGMAGASDRRARSRPQDEAKAGGEAKSVGRIFTGAIAASDVMVADAPAKAALYTSTGALAVDMESHVAATFAAEHRLPFAALRVISDGANRALPRAAQAGMKRDGGMDVLAVLVELAGTRTSSRR